MDERRFALPNNEVGVEVLEEEAAEQTLKRPLALVSGRGYAATWVTARVQREVVVPKRGRPSKLAAERAKATASAAVSWQSSESSVAALEFTMPAEERRLETRVERRASVVRDDGVAFGAGGERTIVELGLDVALVEPASRERLWRWQAVSAYRRGQRPDPQGVFERLIACYDTFVDFDRSLAAQRESCELCACLSLVTWLSDAFALVPYLWITGDRGTGKTQLGTVWAETSYLGEVALASGSFAALRDAGEQGAALYFDDAEAFGGGRRGNGAKRELLLAGNRRGARVGLKTWNTDGLRTRWVPAYAPRAFSSIALPEATLASRAIVVPLGKTMDVGRGRRDPGEPGDWPCNRLELRDDLWALGLWWLSAASAVWQRQEAETAVVGREYEKWRPVLAVAQLLEENGLSGLAARMRRVMLGYQFKRPALVDDDETLEVVLALFALSGNPGDRIHSWTKAEEQLTRMRAEEIAVPTATITEHVRIVRFSETGVLCKEPGLAKRVGRAMGRLRFRSTRGTNGMRAWLISPARVEEVARAHGIMRKEIAR